MERRILRIDGAATLGLLALVSVALASALEPSPSSAEPAPGAAGASAAVPTASAVASVAADVDSLRARIDRVHPQPYRDLTRSRR